MLQFFGPANQNVSKTKLKFILEIYFRGWIWPWLDLLICYKLPIHLLYLRLTMKLSYPVFNAESKILPH